jgi:hypothetical protein
MRPYLESVINVMLDRKPEEWIEGIVVALFLALALAGASGALRRWKKAADETMLLVVPAIVVIFTGMVMAAGYVQLMSKRAARPTEFVIPQGRPFRGPEGGSSRMADLILEAADADRDGRISTDEAATAAARFVKEAEVNGKSALDREALTTSLREHLRPPGGAPPFPNAPDRTPRPPS